jgi:hypothetical protein
MNDNGPEFKQKRYNVSVPEGLPMNQQLLQVEAKDADSGNNARITYSIVEAKAGRSKATPSRLFGIFPNSGILYLTVRFFPNLLRQHI